MTFSRVDLYSNIGSFDLKMLGIDYVCRIYFSIRSKTAVKFCLECFNVCFGGSA